MTQQEAEKLVRGQHIKVLYKGPYSFADREKKGRFTDALVQAIQKGNIYVYLFPTEKEDNLCHEYGGHTLILLDDCYLPTLTNNRKLDAIRKILNKD